MRFKKEKMLELYYTSSLLVECYKKRLLWFYPRDLTKYDGDTHRIPSLLKHLLVIEKELKGSQKDS